MGEFHCAWCLFKTGKKKPATYAIAGSVTCAEHINTAVRFSTSIALTIDPTMTSADRDAIEEWYQTDGESVRKRQEATSE